MGVTMCGDKMQPIIVIVVCLLVALEAALIQINPVNISTVNPDTQQEIGSPLRVAQCRARCLQKVSQFF
jgi:hypothetical protein